MLLEYPCVKYQDMKVCRGALMVLLDYPNNCMLIEGVLCSLDYGAHYECLVMINQWMEKVVANKHDLLGIKNI